MDPQIFKGRKILFVSQYSGFAGGIERYIHKTTGLLRSRGAEVWGCFIEPAREHEEFISCFDKVCPPGELPDEDFDIAGIHKIMDIDFLRKFLAKYKSKATLFVHDHDYYCPRSYKYYPFKRINCFRHHSRMLCGICGMLRSPKQWKHGFFNEVNDRFILFNDRLDLLRRFPHVVVISEFMRDNLLANSFTPETLHVIPPCVELPPEPPQRPDTEVPSIIFIGQLIRGKGADTFMKVLSLLKKPFKAYILGDGNDRPWLESLATDYNLTDKVVFTGWTTRPDDYLAKADLALLPFRWQEPFGLVVAECASWGLPIAAFSQGGVKESLHNNENGFLVKDGDVISLARHTDDLLGDYQLRITMGEKGRKLVENSFSVEQYLKGMSRLLNAN